MGSVNGRTKVAATQITHAKNAAINPTMMAFAYTTEENWRSGGTRRPSLHHS